MNTPAKCHSSSFALAAATSLLLLLAPPSAFAGPGAHGPDGEHLDAPPATRSTAALPRVEAHTDAFELVAELRAGELVILVDRYTSNEPVLGATLEVESGSLKAVAAFRADRGDYVVTDATLLKALAAPGEHGMVFTLMAGQDSDLLDGTLVSDAGRAATAAAGGSDGHAHDVGHGTGHGNLSERTVWIGAGAAGLGLLGGIAWWRRRRRETSMPQGGL
jgi:hypothetical protein